MQGSPLLFLMHIGIRQACIGGDDGDQAMRRITGQYHLVYPLPNANPLLGRFEKRALLRQIETATFGVFCLLVNQAGAEIHHRIVVRRIRRASEG